MERRRPSIITLDMGSVAAELQQKRQSGAAASPTSGGLRRALSAPRRWARCCCCAAPRSEALVRCCAFARFLWTCAVGACCSMAPPTLALCEAATMLLVYLLAVPDAYPTRARRPAPYSFAGSAEDLLLLSLLRSLAVVAAHAVGAGPRHLQRPYLLTAGMLAAVSLPLALLKAVALRHSGWPRRQWPPFLAMDATHAAFALAHLLAAQHIAAWARARWEHGLSGFGFPWQEGEQAWVLAGALAGQAEEGRAGGPAEDEQHDVPAEQLADADSRWARCAGLRVHYKLALPQGSSGGGGAALVLVHSWGGGTFSWRHIQQPLADASGLPVLAFDRPGFGLTERPPVDPAAPPDANPYCLKAQALLALQLSSTLGFRQVALAGHGDGALLALLATAIACREQALYMPLQSPLSSGGAATGGAASAQRPGSSSALPMATAARHQRRASLPDSLDLAWSSSLPEGGSILNALLRGEWAASIDPGWGAAGGRPKAWRSPLRPQRRPEQAAGAAGELLQPLLGQAEPGAGGTDEPLHSSLAAAAGSSSTDAAGSLTAAAPSSIFTNPSFLEPEQGVVGGGGLQQEASVAASSTLLDNPSFVAESSDLEPELSGQRARYSTQEAAAPLPALAEGPTEGEEDAQGGLLFRSNPSFSFLTSAEEAEEGGGEAAAEGGVLLRDNPSFLADSFDAEAAAAAHAAADERARQPGSEAGRAPPQQPELAAELSAGSGASLLSSDGSWQAPEPVGLILLHPDLSGQVAPKYARVLAHSRLGRRLLRRLLRTEMGEVANRRAWANPQALSPDVLALYRRPLHVEGWDRALIAVARCSAGIGSLERGQLLAAVADAGQPVLVVGGEEDRLLPPSACGRILEKLGRCAPRLAVLPRCAHLSHEEAPHTLLAFLLPFARDLRDRLR